MMPDQKKSFWIEYGAALWALIFAALHLAWAMGWYICLEAEAARKAFTRGWFFAYNLIAAGLCVLAVAVALALLQSWRRRLPRLLISMLAWSCAGILVLRGGAAILQAVYWLAVGGSGASVLSFWDGWFCLGAVLFAASAWRFRHSAH